MKGKVVLCLQGTIITACCCFSASRQIACQPACSQNASQRADCNATYVLSQLLEVIDSTDICLKGQCSSSYSRNDLPLFVTEIDMMAMLRAPVAPVRVWRCTLITQALLCNEVEQCDTDTASGTLHTHNLALRRTFAILQCLQVMQSMYGPA